MNNLNEYELNAELINESNEFENQEYEWAGQLETISNEYEYENFLGNLLSGLKNFYNSQQGQNIKKDFISGAKSFGRKMLPSLGKNIGSAVGGSKWGQFGGQIGDAIGNTWLQETGEFETVDYIRVIRKAAKILNSALGSNPNLSIPPRTMVTKAINAAARPVLQAKAAARRGYGPSQGKGRWIRKGNQITVIGVR